MRLPSIDFRARFGSFILSRLVASGRGRAFLFAFMVDAEESDEGAFDELAARVVTDPVVHKVIRTHQADEARHGAILRGCLARTGATPPPLPTELRYIDRLDRATDGKFRRGFPDEPTAGGLMKVYALLEAIEERGVLQFAAIARALRPVDAASAAAVEEIVADERRHVQYAHAIARRYAPDDATHARTLAEMRALAAAAFAEHGAAFARYLFEHELLAMPRFLQAALAVAAA